tara:strand:+ start:238 stop:414 length:177 start_codon:yes stop_codon:yes gene_type:complete
LEERKPDGKGLVLFFCGLSLLKNKSCSNNGITIIGGGYETTSIDGAFGIWNSGSSVTK